MVDISCVSYHSISVQNRAGDNCNENLLTTIVVLLRVDGCSYEHAWYCTTSCFEYRRTIESYIAGYIRHVCSHGNDSYIGNIAYSILSLQTRL